LNNTIRRVGVVSFVLVMLSIGAVSRAAREDEAFGRTVTYTGYLEQGGTPVSGRRELGFQLFDSRTGTTRIWPTGSGSSSVEVPVTSGRFVVELGGDGMSSLPASAFSTPELWLQVSVGGVALEDRQRVGTSRHASNGSPAGTVSAWLGTGAEPPDGWAFCEGQTVDSRDPHYTNLWRAIRDNYGDAGDGPGGMFVLPDLRGLFLRGVDGGRGIDPGRELGTQQPSQVGPHTHPVHDPGHSHRTDICRSHGNWTFGGNNWATQTCDWAAPTYQATTGISVQANAGSETRPVNFSVRYIVRL
jgi:microcystin-dependent protein